MRYAPYQTRACTHQHSTRLNNKAAPVMRMQELFQQRTEAGTAKTVNLGCFFCRCGVNGFQERHEETYYGALDTGPCWCLHHAVCVHSTRNV